MPCPSLRPSTRPSTWPSSLVATFGLLVTAACGSSASSPHPDARAADAGIDAGPTAELACTQNAMARCTKLMACSPAELAARWGDVATCETRLALGCRAALAAPGTAATPTGTIQCADALTASACGDFLGKSPPPACLPPMGPTAAAGTCEFSGQCASGFCGVAATSLCGACEPEPQVGSSCATVDCGPTLTCVAATMTCENRVALSGACGKGLPCDVGLACVGATAVAMGTCQAAPTTVGAVCDPARKTGPDCSAVAGLTCDHATKQCVTQPLAAATMPCGLINNVEVRCTGPATCVGAMGAQPGTCVAPAADGAACDSATGPDCETPARCVPTAAGTAGTCQLPGSKTCP
jgi:hypothetical protein